MSPCCNLFQTVLNMKLRKDSKWILWAWCSLRERKCSIWNRKLVRISAICTFSRLQFMMLLNLSSSSNSTWIGTDDNSCRWFALIKKWLCKLSCLWTWLCWFVSLLNECLSCVFECNVRDCSTGCYSNYPMLIGNYVFILWICQTIDWHWLVSFNFRESVN